MILSTGVDIIEVDRIQKAIMGGTRFRDRVFTKSEMGYCESQTFPFMSYAVRFAAKEALMKALGTGWSEGIAWTDIEVARESTGDPSLVLHGRAQELFGKMGGKKAHLSLAHTRKMAVAFVTIEGE